MGVQGNNYAKWSEQELRKAVSVADRFLLENGDQIHENFRAKVDALDELIESLHEGDLTFDERPRLLRTYRGGLALFRRTRRAFSD